MRWLGQRWGTRDLPRFVSIQFNASVRMSELNMRRLIETFCGSVVLNNQQFSPNA